MLSDAFADTMSCLHLCIERLFGFGSHALHIRLKLGPRFAGVREVYFPLLSILFEIAASFCNCSSSRLDAQVQLVPSVTGSSHRPVNVRR
jgi:hypothetical protein